MTTISASIAALCLAHMRGIDTVVRTWAESNSIDRFELVEHPAIDVVGEPSGVVRRTAIHYDGRSIGEVTTLREGLTYRVRVEMTEAP